jgi:peptide/nickel transport system substrate-binding protein
MTTSALLRRIPDCRPLWLAIVLLAACAKSPQPPNTTAAANAETPRRGGTVVIGTPDDFQGVHDLAPGNTQFTADLITRLMFLHLLEEQPDYTEHPPTFAPGLAERYEWSADRRQLTFHLRPGALWSDGHPITAEDVRWTWQAQTNADVAWDYAYSKESITDVEVVDAQTARFHFARSYFSQLTDANEGVILPRHAWSQLPFARWRDSGDWFREHLVVSGPFTLERWSPQQEIVFQRNPRYFEPSQPLLDRVVFRIIPDLANQIAQLLAGSLDYVEQVPAADAERLSAASGTALLEFFSRQYTYVQWNTARPLFADPEVRRALALGTNRQALVDAIWHGHASVGCSPLISSVWAHDDTLEPWPYDPAEASRVLAARGWADADGDGILERGGRPFAFELITNAGNPAKADATVMLQEQWRRIGVAVTPRIIEFNSLVERQTRHEFDASIMSWGIDTSLDISYAFHSRSIADAYNYGSYRNAEVDALLDRLRDLGDPALAQPLFARVEAILHQEQPGLFLWEPKRLDARSQRLQGARPNALSSFFNIREWWLRPTP